MHSSLHEWHRTPRVAAERRIVSATRATSARCRCGVRVGDTAAATTASATATTITVRTGSTRTTYSTHSAIGSHYPPRIYCNNS